MVVCIEAWFYIFLLSKTYFLQLKNENIMAEKEIIQMQNNDYDELLLRAVAVIEKTRTDVARHIAIAASNTYWEIGKLLYEKKLESRHGSQVVKRQM